MAVTISTDSRSGDPSHGGPLESTFQISSAALIRRIFVSAVAGNESSCLIVASIEVPAIFGRPGVLLAAFFFLFLLPGGRPLRLGF